MPISFDRYVRITSGVGAGAAVRRRDLIARFFTTSSLVPAKTIVEFTSPDDVGDYFGTTSAEFLRSQFYFGFVSKIITRPKRISFARWVNSPSAPMIFGTNHEILTELQKISAGTFSLTLGDTTTSITGLDFTSDTSFSDVASALQTEIRKGTGTVFTAATVTYNAIMQRFEFAGGETGEAEVTVTAGSSNDVAGAIGWLSGAIICDGAEDMEIPATLADTSEISNNFGSFAFIPTLTTDQITQVATWNSTQNVLYQYHVAVTPENAAAVSAAVINLAGVGLTLNTMGLSNEYPEVLPMAVLAATDYTRRASVQNYMYQSANLTPTVSSNADANIYDGLRVNYYGETQTAGQIRRFYQRGVLGGGDTAPVDMNTYANEQWLKDDAGARIMSLLLSLPRVSANQSGRAQLLGVVQSTIDQALENGSISIGRTLTDVQIIFITEQTGDAMAYHQVQTSGYWVNAVIESFQTTDNRTEFRANYTLIYAKDDVIRSVEGTHTLI